MTARRLQLPALSVVLGLLTCPLPSAIPAGRLDDSWGFALHANVTGAFGSVPVTYFTYGPLGFLAVPTVWERKTYLLALLFAVAVQVALCGLLLVRLRRVAPVPVAVAVTLLVAALVNTYSAENLVVVAAVLASEVLVTGVQRPRLAWSAGCLAAGAALLLKFSTGVVTALLLVIVSASLGRRRWAVGAASGLGSLTAAAALFGIVTGDPGAFPHWLRASQEISRGYVAMALEDPAVTTSHQYVWSGVLIAALVGVSLALALRHRSRAAVVGGAAILLTTYLSFREGFERHDTIHVAVLVSALTFLPFALQLGPRSRWLLVPLVLGPLTFGVWVAHTTHPTQRYALVSNVERLADRAHLVLDASVAQAQGRRGIRARLPVPDRVLVALKGHRVHVDPYDTALVWAYGLTWAPSAVYANYSSYTPWLDARNAESLRGPRAPDRILRYRGSPAIDGRFGMFESPRYQLELQCRWQVVLEAGPWQVLEPGADRCTAPQVIGRAEVMPGRDVTVPTATRPGAVVAMQLSLDLPDSYRLAALLFKPRTEVFVMLDGVRYQLVVATSGEPLVLRTPADGPGAPNSFRPVTVNRVSVTIPAKVVFEEFDPPTPVR